jgi:rare lipoprotein A
MYAMTAAHRTLPLPTYARVRNLRNGRSVVVRINDRGPFHPNRIIDLSYAAASRLGIARNGTGLVEVTAIDPTRPVPLAAAPRPDHTNLPVRPPRLFLQVGAFGSRNNAERLQARIEPALAASVRIQALASDSRPLYRVQIGPLATVQRVDALSSRLQRDWGLNDMYVVVD